MKEYWSATRLFTYNFILGGLLLLLYHLSLMLFSGDTGVVNAVDHFFQSILSLIPNGLIYVSIALMLIGVVFLYLDYKKEVKVKPVYLFWMFVEAFAWSLLVFFNLGYLLNKIPFFRELITQQMGNEGPGLLQNLSLSLGAGFYEEFFFRFLLIKLLSFAQLLLLKNPKSISNTIFIVTASAFLFSAAHLDIVLGSMGEEFNMYSFVFRFVFGLLMNLMMVFRGFAIAAWTHALYDVWVYIFRAIV